MLQPETFRKTREYLGTFVAPDDDPVVVNSYGRSGSTMLTNTIKSHYVKNTSHALPFGHYVASKCIGLSAWKLDRTKIQKGFVYKTHDRPPASIPHDMKMIYVFSNPVDVVASLLELNRLDPDWMELHCERLGSEYSRFPDIRIRDSLELESHFDSWRAENRIPILFLRYETMWENEGCIEEFLGRSISLPARRARSTRRFVTQEDLQVLERAYQHFEQRVSQMPDVWRNDATPG